MLIYSVCVWAKLTTVEIDAGVVHPDPVHPDQFTNAVRMPN